MANESDSPSHLAGADAAQLREFLASAPEDLRGWADEQAARLDAEATGVADTAAEGDDAVGLEAFPEFTDDDSPARPAAKGGDRANRPRGGASKVNLILVALLAAAVVIIVQQAGRSTQPDMSASAGNQTTSVPTTATEFPPLDEARAAELKQQAEADPANAEPLRELGKLHFDSGLYQDAVDFFERALQLQPDDVEVLLSLGVAQYSLNNFDAAEQRWLRATEIAPTLPEPWYNLGFLYLAQTPPDYAGVEKAWGKVIEIAPDSDLAQTAAAHLERLRSPSSTPSPGR